MASGKFFLMVLPGPSRKGLFLEPEQVVFWAFGAPNWEGQVESFIVAGLRVDGTTQVSWHINIWTPICLSHF